MSAPKFPKIDTLFERKEDFSIDETKIRRPEFLTPKEWIVTEKIDGMNIRISLESQHQYEDGIGTDVWVVKYYGRNENSQFPPLMLEHLQKTFTLEKMQALWRDDDKYQIVLYGEGYGAGIQKGGGYNKEKTFRLFDVLIGDVWLSRENVEDVAKQLDIKCAPNLNKAYNVGLLIIIKFVRLGIESVVAEEEGDKKNIAEGIVAQTGVPLFNSRGQK